MKKPYIVFEGIVGSGKSTQIKLLYSYLLKKYSNVILTKEPGSTEISDNIRKIAQGTFFKEHMNPITEAYLYAASRAQSLRAIILPSLNEGKIVLSDRSIISSLAFQGYGRDLGFDTILEINKLAVCVFPSLVFYLDVKPEIAVKRTSDKKGDKFELMDLEFHKKVEKGYKEILKKNIVSYYIIDGNRSINEIFEEIKEKCEIFLKEINY
ncbi:MAG: dTMP kinase [Candidatus Woesearchaeota archaeon]